VGRVEALGVRFVGAVVELVLVYISNVQDGDGIRRTAFEA